MSPSRCVTLLACLAMAPGCASGPCGGTGQPLCPGDKSPDLALAPDLGSQPASDGSSTNCASPGDPCCPWGVCNNGLFCTDGHCSSMKADHSSFEGCTPGESCGNGATCVRTEYSDPNVPAWFCSSTCTANGGCPGLEFAPVGGGVFCSAMGGGEAMGQCYVFCNEDKDCPAKTLCKIANLTRLCLPVAQ